MHARLRDRSQVVWMWLWLWMWLSVEVWSLEGLEYVWGCSVVIVWMAVATRRARTSVGGRVVRRGCLGMGREREMEGIVDVDEGEGEVGMRLRGEWKDEWDGSGRMEKKDGRRDSVLRTQNGSSAEAGRKWKGGREQAGSEGETK